VRTSGIRGLIVLIIISTICLAILTVVVAGIFGIKVSPEARDAIIALAGTLVGMVVGYLAKER
jgi:hypothetical protein